MKNRLDTMIEKGFQILVGDANSADKAIQRYLADKSYPNVLVHCMKDHCGITSGSGQPVSSFQPVSRTELASRRTRRAKERNRHCCNQASLSC